MIDLERIQRLAEKMGNRNDALELVRQMRCGGRKFGEGGPEKKRLFDKKKIADRIPADGGYPGGTSGVIDAVRHYLSNDDNYVGDRIRDAMVDASRGALDPESLSQMLAHEDAKRIYLGMPQEYGSFEPSPYRPTIGSMDDPYQLNGLLSDSSFENTILPMYATWKTGKDWPLYDTGSRVTNLGKTAQLSDFPYLHRAGMSEGFDDKGQYISLQDTWDYNTAVKGRSGDNVGKWIGGKPFDIYQRYYLDDWLDVPDEAKGNPYIAPSYIEADYTGPRYVPDYTFWGLPQDRGELDSTNEFGCGGKKYPDGGKFFRTTLQNESPMMYQPMPPMYHDLVPPIRFRPEPDNGDYVAPVSTGMVQGMPIGRTYLSMVPETGVLMDEMERPSVIDLFSDEAKARRALKQRYAESAFDDRAVSNAGAQGAWQIMPITLKDYLGRGRGKAGDLNDPEYNRRVRDWVMGIIPRDLKEFWSESDSDRAKLAKLYAAYNWGAGNLRSFLRKKRDAGIDISNPDNWVDDLNPETRRYVKYLAFDEDIPDSIYTNSAFEDAARKNGYMAEGGRLYEMGGPEKTYQDYLDEYNAARRALNEASNAEKSARDTLRDFQQSYRGEDGRWSPYWYWSKEGKRLDAEASAADDRLREARDAFGSAANSIGGATLEKYSGTSADPMRFWQGIATTKEGAEKYFMENAIRESAGAQEVADYFKSYANSPGYSRISENQKQWWKNRHPYRKIYEGTGRAMDYTNQLQKGIQVSPYGVFDLSITPQISKMRIKPGAGMITVGTNEEKEWPYYFVLPHEMAHIVNTYGIPSYSAQAEALEQNTNTAPGHDSELPEKHSDKLGLMFLLYKEGIYDSRGEENCTPEDIAKLRKKYPGLRPLQQMDDEQAAWMINHVADVNEDIDMSNIAASGGKISIKPENRGKFNALLKRTGKPASWFKAHGTPLQKKRATFALNARKWKHGDGGPLDNYFYDGGPYGVIPLGGDYLTYLQTIPEVSGGVIDPAVVTAALPSKFNGSQAAAERYAEGYLKGAKPVSEALSRAGRDIFNTVDTVVGLTPTPAGALTWLGHMGKDAVEGEWGKVGRDALIATALGAGARGIGWLKNYVDDATNFSEDIFRAFTDWVPGRVSTNFTYAAPAARATVEAVPAVSKVVSAPYEIENLGGGYMLKSLMRGNKLESKLAKDGSIKTDVIRGYANQSGGVQKAVMDKVLASEEFVGKKSIDYNKFRKAVQDELITYDRTPDTRWATYGEDALGFRAGSPTELREINDARTFNDKRQAIEVYGTYEEKLQLRDMTHLFRDGEMTEAEYDDAFDKLFSEFSYKRTGGAKSETFTFSSSRIPNGSARHYDANTLGHSRTYTTADEPDVLHVMESQSDWGQGYKKMNFEGEYNQKRINSLERRINNLQDSINSETEGLMTKKMNDGSDMSPWFEDSLRQQIDKDKQLLEELSIELDMRKNPKLAVQQDYLADNFTSRQIQENLRYAAEKGQTKMRYPTRETAAKIEGYSRGEAYFDSSGRDVTADGPVYTYGEDVDKRISEINKRIDFLEGNPGGDAEMNEYTSLLGERMRLLQGEAKLKPGITKKEVWLVNGDPKVAEMILQKYDAFPKQFKKLYKNADVRIVTDSKGNTWYEVDVPEDYLQQEWAYEEGGSMILPKMMMDKHSPDKLRKAIASIKAKRMK